jgi:signal transduction histidine kinase/predicted RNA-binding protein with RPS1 domain
MTTPAEHSPIVEVTIIRLLPFGLLVRLPDEQVGIIREREIAWDAYQRRRWRRHFKRGDTHRAVPLGIGHDERLELSLRLAENDPWQSLTERYQLGQIVTGTIEGVKPYGVFVEIEPGITGLLHQNRLPLWAQSYPTEQLFWPGDRIKVALEHLDPLHRKIGLTMQRVWPTRWKQTGPLEPALHLAPVPAPLPATPSYPTVAWNVLVVEDDQLQREAVAGWLTQSLQRVNTATSAEEGLALLGAQPFDMVLMDFNLPGISGLEALQHIGEQWPAVRRVLMTDWALAGQHPVELDQLLDSGAQLLIKPLLPSDLTAILSDAPTNAELGTEPDTAQAIERATTSQLRDQRQHQQHLLTDMLKRLRQVTGASHAALFQFDRAQRTISIVAQAGAAQLQRSALPDLIYSPVRDAAADKKIVRIDDAQQAEARVRYLKPLLNFRACLGMPLQHSLRDGYALFLFSPQPGAFKDGAIEQHAAMIALVAGALIEQGDFNAHAWDMQRLALLGQLSRALVHEINHQLSPINFALSDLERQYGLIQQALDSRPARLARDINEAHEILSDLMKGVERLTSTARMFGRLTIQSREQHVPIEGVVSEVLQLVNDMARRANIHMHMHIAPSLPPVRGQAAQLQQILLNIVINAIQQIELVRVREGGQVQISAKLLPDIGVQIAVEDDGAGIHREQWEHIFELGFTTRTEGGSGLGLYITRSLVEALGGRVYVAESLMLWGSTLVVEFPIE